MKSLKWGELESMYKYDLLSVNNCTGLKTLRYPMSVYIKLTAKCMLNCEFCSQATTECIEANVEDVKKILKELNKIGVIYVYYTGGEPLMYCKLKEVLQYGYSLGFKQILVTNGILLSYRRNRELSKYLVAIGISLHGKKDVHEALVGNLKCFDMTLNNIKLLKKENPNISININCTAVDINTSYENFEFLASVCKENDLRMSIARLNYIGNGCSYEYIDANIMLKIVNELNLKGYDIRISNCIATCTVDEKYKYLTHGCGAGQSIAAIESNGDVKICASSNMVLGNVLKMPFKYIWKNRSVKSFQKLNWIPIKCRECQNFYSCKGGCKAELSGNFENELCDSSVFRLFNEEWNKIKDRKIYVRYGVIRIEKIDTYIIPSIPAKKCNYTTMKFLLKINGEMTGNELIDISKNKVKAKELLIALSLDGIIGVNH